MLDTMSEPAFSDVLILGAGLSGIGCAAYLAQQRPDTSVLLLEMRDDLGGTWDLFRYPGIRSDSDLYTFAYGFKPWDRPETIASGPEIKRYIGEAASEAGILDRIRFGRKVTTCDWSSEQALWTVTTRQADGTIEVWRARWIFSATGYYDYAQGYRPDFPHEDSFTGQIVHPQHWPEGLDYDGKRVAVIGSGATAVTLLPELAKRAAHVVQVQRTPSYVMPIPAVDPLLGLFRRILPKDRVAPALRRKNIWKQNIVYRLCQRYPNRMRRLIRWVNRKQLPDAYPVDTHFNPPYDPWDQRLCAVPGGDLFHALSDGSCSIVTGGIARFRPEGIEMQDGTLVEADIIVTATGLTLRLMGGAQFSIDGAKVRWSDHLIFKGMMLDGIPNFAMAVGYTNSSWTLKVDLLCQYFCRLLSEMEGRGMAVCTPQRPEGHMETRPLLDFAAGYVKRSIDTLPRQGPEAPWVMSFNYRSDEAIFAQGAVIEPQMQLTPLPQGAPA
ncbi:flavin-containing monooxygenase [Donghicola sp. XS_ASV15]|uniref:flavin-containing monooxygenase n=1 Tax=Donghicola sp. XS_ASV15 TaxID=3241295 RepID=UPI003512AB13